MIVSFSGGVDSTAMLAILLEQHHQIRHVVFFDTGWEHPRLHAHLAQVESTFEINLVRLKPPFSFNYLLQAHPVRYRCGPQKAEIKHYGRGWPSWSHRWCTGEKVKALARQAAAVENPIVAIGYNYGEQKRTLKRNPNGHQRIYPLLAQQITHAKAHEICRHYGFHWHGLYEEFDRVGCFCCPFQRVHQLQTIKNYHPDLWQRIHQMDQRIAPPKRIFAKRKTFEQLDQHLTKRTLPPHNHPSSSHSMPKLPPPQLYHMLGLGPTGDLGPYTFYTKQNRTIVWFLKAPPKSPPTDWQIRQRELWKAAAAEWRNMPLELKAQWQQVQSAANLGITSYNLWIYFFCTNDRPAIRTLEHQTGLTLLDP